MAAMMAGFFSLVQTAEGHYLEAAQLIMLSMALDGLDGNLARWLKGQTSFGADLDTMVDVISFGAAPAFLAYQCALHQWGGVLGPTLAGGMLMSGASRLSRFRILDAHRGQRGFLGLPITVNAGWVALVVYIVQAGLQDAECTVLHSSPWAILVWGCSAAFILLQVSHVHYPKPTKDLGFFIPAVCLVICLFIGVELGLAAAVAMCAYGLFYSFLMPLLPRPQADEGEESEDDEPVPVHHS